MRGGAEQDAGRQVGRPGVPITTSATSSGIAAMRDRVSRFGRSVSMRGGELGVGCDGRQCATWRSRRESGRRRGRIARRSPRRRRTSRVQLQHLARQIEAAADQHPARAAARARSRRSASATCGPGRATPPEAATIASTGMRQVLPGFRHRPQRRGVRQQRAQELGGVLACPSCRRSGAPAGRPRWQMRAEHLAGAGIVAAVQPELPARRQQRGQPAVQALQPRRPFGARRCRRAIAASATRKPGRAQRGDGDAGVVELVRPGQRRRRQQPARPVASA